MFTFIPVSLLLVISSSVTISCVSLRGEKTEWVTDEYIDMNYEHDDLKQKMEKSKDPELWTKYKDMRNKINNYKEQCEERILPRENML